MAIAGKGENTVFKTSLLEGFQVVVSNLPSIVVSFLQSPLNLLVVNRHKDVVLGG